MPLAIQVVRVFLLSCCFAVSQPLAFAQEAGTAPAQTGVATLPLSAYVGQYQAGEAFGKFMLAVRLVDGKLTIESATLPSTPLEVKSGDRFAIPGGPEFSFERGADGKITSLTVAADDGKPEHALKLAHITSQDVALNHNRPYVSSEAMIPMRDGVKLHTVILRPGDKRPGEQGLPFLMERTPYGVQSRSPAYLFASKSELAESGYIFVFQDIRGRYGSEGSFVMNHPVVAHTSRTDVDEVTDTRDTIDWLLKNAPDNNGTVGVFGVSYPGFLAIMAAVQAHPAVKAVSPQAPMTDAWMGDDFFHNGAFRQTYGFDYVQQIEAQKTDKPQNSTEDQYDFFLQHVNFSGAANAAGMTDLPTAKLFLHDPSYDRFWQDRAVQGQLGKPETAILEVGGYWDQEDMWGPQTEYAILRAHEEASDPQHKVFLVLGPWNHGGWQFGSASELVSKWGGIHFGDQKTGAFYRSTFEAPFFEHYLKGKPGFDLQDTASFRTGENQWHRYPVWPPRDGFHTVSAYLADGGALSGAAPQGSGKGQAASWVSDPANPVPYRHRPVQSTYGEDSTWRQWLVEDQSFVADRKDLAKFSTAGLPSDVTVTGDVVADLFASTTGTDGDWVVKLIDVSPDGYQLMVADEILRGRYRKSFTDPQPMKPGEVNEYKWSLHGVDHTFLKGHKMMVEVQSTWFPLYDRNPQTYVPNIMTAPAPAYKAQTVTIYNSAAYPSHLQLPVTDGSTLP